MIRDRKLRRLYNQQREAIEHTYSARLSKATGPDYQRVKRDYDRETDECTYNLWSLETAKLLRKADRYDLDYSNPEWYVDPNHTQGERILTESAQRELRR